MRQREKERHKRGAEANGEESKKGSWSLVNFSLYCTVTGSWVLEYRCGCDTPQIWWCPGGVLDSPDH